MSRFLKSASTHPLVAFLLNLKGNPKVLVFLEPLWGIPYYLIIPFATLYMTKLGITDIQIGLILSISMIFQVGLSFMGGIAADKLGRKHTTVLGDFWGWSVACFVWAISQNFWFFLIAYLLNSNEQLNQTAWSCLLIEDAEEKDTLNIYMWITIAGLLAVFFAPISGVLIDRFSLVPVVRVLYMCFSVFMLLKSLITLRYTSETRQGKIRMAETKGVPIHKLVFEYKELVPRIFKNKATIQTLAIMAILHITNLIHNTFFGLYAYTRLDVAERYLAIFPILRALVMLVFLFVIQNFIQRLPFKLPMQAGFLVYIACQALLIFAPRGEIWPAAVCTLMEAIGFSLVMPRKDVMLALNVDPKERARTVALLFTFMIVFAMPFGYFAGLLSSIDRRLPFVFAAVLHIAALAVLSRYHEPEGTEIDVA